MSNLKEFANTRFCIVLAAFTATILLEASASGQCPSEPPLQNNDGAGSVACPCFVEGEQAGVILQAPPSHYPLEILRIGIGWGSIFNGNPPQLEYALYVYEGTLPNPGTPVFGLLGPQLTDGVSNEYNIEAIPGDVTISSGPFIVSLEFLNNNAGNQFASSVVHDGNGCQPGKNVVYAAPGNWYDACALGVTGDWSMYVIYRPCTATDVNDTHILSVSPAMINGAYPNPFTADTHIEFTLQAPQSAALGIFDVKGRRVAAIAAGQYATGTHTVDWNGRNDAGQIMPTGIYFAQLQAGEHRSVRKLILMR